MVPSNDILLHEETAMIDITEKDFSIDEAVERARRPEIGAIVTFLGTVRDDGITSMELEAYREAAMPELEKIRDEAVARFDLQSVEVIHRVGSLHIGDNIALIVCGAAHRQSAFDGCKYIIDELKARVPIWKKEVLSEGERWVGL
jgi:molybdopterin synthase catalytic subunit